MDDLFNCPKLRVQQPGKWLQNRASYHILGDQRQLLAVATETEAHSRLQLFSKAMPDARVLTVSTVADDVLLTLIRHGKDRVTEIHGPDNQPLGRIRATHTTRHYTLLDEADQTVGKVVGDLALKHFSVTGPDGPEFARIRKTWAGLTKEMLTSSDHYQVEFTGPATSPARVLTVMTAIVLDLSLYGPI